VAWFGKAITKAKNKTVFTMTAITTTAVTTAVSKSCHNVSTVKIKLTVFWAENGKWVANLPEEVQKYKPHNARQYNVYVFALWH